MNLEFLERTVKTVILSFVSVFAVNLPSVQELFTVADMLLTLAGKSVPVLMFIYTVRKPISNLFKKIFKR